MDSTDHCQAEIPRPPCSSFPNAIECNLLKARSIVPEDVDTLALLAEEFEQQLNSMVEGRHNRSRMTREVFLRDAFGERPGFHGIILETHDKPLGYLLYCFGYNTDLAACIVQVIDLFIRSDEQSKGFGRFLMRALIPICHTAGINVISVSVWKANLRAQRFYTQLGAESADEEVFLWPSVTW